MKPPCSPPAPKGECSAAKTFSFEIYIRGKEAENGLVPPMTLIIVLPFRGRGLLSFMALW